MAKQVVTKGDNKELPDSHSQTSTQLSKNEKGATMVEYGVMVAMIVVGSIMVIGQVGYSLNQNTFQVVNDQLALAQGGVPFGN